MGTRNQTTDKEMKCPYVIFPGQTGTPFLKFVQSLHQDIMIDDLPEAQLPTAGKKRLALLRPRPQEIFFKVTNMVIDVIEAGYCFKKLHEEMIVITDHFELPMLLYDNLEPRTDEGLKMNMVSLAEMLDRVVSAASSMYEDDDTVNPDFKELLLMMKVFMPGDDPFLIRYPIAYCPLVNRSAVMVILYDFTMDILRFADPKAYTHVISGLKYPLDWYVSLQDNSNLLKHSKRGTYDPQALKNKTDPRLELIRLHRNGPAHPYQGTADSNAAHGITWSREEMSRTFYFLCPRLISSMQITLHVMGELRHLKTEHLFAYARKKLFW